MVLQDTDDDMTDSIPESPSFAFSSHPSCSSFAINLESYVAHNPVKSTTFGATIQTYYIATGAMVFDKSSPQRILLVQRASTDSMPNLWEVPGGAVDPEDPTILHAVARELREEAGLTATNIGPQVGEVQIFVTRRGLTICKFHFLIDAKTSPDGTMDVKLDPGEHQSYVWATEEQVKAGRVNDVQLKWTLREQEAPVLEAFLARNAQSKI
ncbi:NUDIX hydrolase domain-like protein [Exophiala viscosa]|uniref:NUDIX hydrolase domain-like protein n=1 Tax=Exophiala viscosa TaxID=2486360 RepID=A0AAN6E229_9EURO|nr:NUDIX hydrolase domain-like protein [Exophiala viscosa]KAI1619522.1 NUDIX hydrolase domain-like protein [Exophiala viscosa]